MGDDARDALATTDGRALAGEIVEQLEAELVRFCHRVAHDHGIELDRARAALVLLGTLVSAGVPWTARPDSAPNRLHDAFSQVAARHPKTTPLGAILRREIATFFVVTTSITVEDYAVVSPAVRLRRAGAEPSLWRWAHDLAKPDACWADCGDDVGGLVQIALAFGVSSEQVLAALAASLAVVIARVKTRRTVQRQQLVPLLAQLGGDAGAALADRTLVATITKLAFEVTAGRQVWSQQSARPPDVLDDLAIAAFQLVEQLRATDKPPDLERIATLARSGDRAFAQCGLRHAALLRKSLDEPVATAIARL